jgi:PAS domain S-box-containing protein
MKIELDNDFSNREGFYKNILENISNGVWVTDKNDMIIYANNEMTNVAGVSKDQIEGNSVLDGFSEDTLKDFRKMYLRVKSTLFPSEYEVRVTTPSGKNSVQRGWLIPYKKNNMFDGMICTVEDVTEKYNLVKLLRESEEEYRSLFDKMLNGFALHEIVTDDNGKPCDYIFIAVNKIFERMTGLKSSDITGKKVTQVLPGIEKDPADWIGRYGRIALEGFEETFETYSQALNKWFRITAYSPSRKKFATIFEDITERKAADEQLRQYRENLENLVKERTKELEEKNAKLEKFNKLFVDREFRIKELKDRVKELEAKCEEK